MCCLSISSIERSLDGCTKHVTLKQGTALNQNPVNLWSTLLGRRVPSERSFQDSCVCVSVTLLLKVMMPAATGFRVPRLRHSF
jgi:hypothetical protein